MRKAVVLLSGGIDSATCCGLARRDGYAIYAMSFAYGQRHAVELDAAGRVAQFFEVKQHSIVNIDLRAFGGSSLTSDSPVPKDREVSGEAGDIPDTYVPARNTVFLSFALGWAEVLDCYDIFIGVNAVDYSGYPDCRPEFIAAYERMAHLATRAGVEGRGVKLHAPLQTLNKAQIIRLGIKCGVDFSLTHSCYDPAPDGRACGACDSCRIRRRGFEEAGVADPTRYRGYPG
ncbi:MAG: 7-cyano-7-deazaguanine synthase QueC [Chitinispirillaceae bacterium]|nr:7-cyano-7-deazaguanine synthase QueC [Chitinispirillaceae bacterium]